MQAAAGGHVQRRAAGTIHLVPEIDQADFAFCARLQQNAAGAVAKQDAGGTVGVVHDRTHRVCADDEHLFVCPALNKLRAYLQRIKKTRACRGQVESPRVGRTQLGLDKAGRRRKQHVRCDRSNDNAIDVAGVDAPFAKAILRCLGRHVTRGLPRVDHVALANPGALHDPLVGGLNHLLQIGVGEQARGNIRADAGNLGSNRNTGLQLQTQRTSLHAACGRFYSPEKNTLSCQQQAGGRIRLDP